MGVRQPARHTHTTLGEIRVAARPSPASLRSPPPPAVRERGYDAFNSSSSPAPRVLRARLLTGFNPTRDGLVFFHCPLPIPTPGLALCRRAVRDGLHRVIQLSDPALWPLARYERRPDWDACRRAFVAGGVPVDPCRRAYGPVGHSPGCLVLCLDGDGLGAGLPAAAVVLALTAAADRQWRRAAVCLVGFADLDRPIG